MAKPIPPARRRPLSERDRAKLAQLGEQLAEAQARVDLVRADLDGRLARCYKAGVPIAELARVAGVSRPTVYQAINRAQPGA
jgi:hypothetical protein